LWLLACACPDLARRAPSPIPSSRAERARGKLRSAELLQPALAVRVSLRPTPMRREAQSHTETALLRLVEALVQRLLRIGQSPQRCSAGGQRIRTIAQALCNIRTLPCNASRLTLCDPVLADVTDRLLDRGPVLFLGGRQLQSGLECRDARIDKSRDVISCQLRTVWPLGWRRLLRGGECRTGDQSAWPYRQ
jgi:hypothetical protein